MTNTATGTAKDSVAPFPTVTSNQATATVTAVQSPLLAVVKTSTTPRSRPPARVPYTFTVTNTGNMTLTGITVTDPKCSGGAGGSERRHQHRLKLQLTETWVYGCTHTVTQAEVDAGGNLSNTVTADSAESAPDTDTLNIPIAQSPAIDVVKSSTTTSVTAAGQVVPYTFTVTNTGNITLTGITVSDPKCDAAPIAPDGDTNSDSKLQLTETWVYRLLAHGDAGRGRRGRQPLEHGDGRLGGVGARRRHAEHPGRAVAVDECGRSRSTTLGHGGGPGRCRTRSRSRTRATSR